MAVGLKLNDRVWRRLCRTFFEGGATLGGLHVIFRLRLNQINGIAFRAIRLGKLRCLRVVHHYRADNGDFQSRIQMFQRRGGAEKLVAVEGAVQMDDLGTGLCCKALKIDSAMVLSRTNCAR